MNTRQACKSFLSPRALLSEIKRERPIPTYEKIAVRFSRQKNSSIVTSTRGI